MPQHMCEGRRTTLGVSPGHCTQSSWIVRVQSPVSDAHSLVESTQFSLCSGDSSSFLHTCTGNMLFTEPSPPSSNNGFSGDVSCLYFIQCFCLYPCHYHCSPTSLAVAGSLPLGSPSSHFQATCIVTSLVSSPLALDPFVPNDSLPSTFTSCLFVCYSK